MKPHDSIDYWKNLVESLAQGVLITNEQGTMLYVNQFAAELFERSPLEMISRTFSYPLATNDDQEIEILQKDGSIITAHLKIKVGAWKQHFAWIISLSDLSSIKLQEKQLALSSAVFNSAIEGIVVIDDALTVQQANKAFLSMTSLSYQAIKSKSLNKFLKCNSNARSLTPQIWEDIYKVGYWRGEIKFKTPQDYLIPFFVSISAIKDEAGDITNYILFFYDLREIREQEEKIAQVKTYDYLTGILNTQGLVAKLNYLINKINTGNYPLQLLSIKVFYNLLIAKKNLLTLSNKDALIIETVHLIDRLTTKKILFARVGYNEFIVIFHTEPNQSNLTLVARKIIQRLADLKHGIFEGYDVESNIGLVELDKNNREDAEKLLQKAEIARVRSSELGKNNYTFYNADLEAKIQVLNHHIESLSHAIDNDELRLFYQPKVDIIQNKVIGLEALLRWQHPEKGLLKPGDFLLNQCDEHPISLKLGEWVIAQVLLHLKKLTLHDIHLPISINISPYQIQQENFKEHFVSLLSRHNTVFKNKIILEVLETVALENLASVNQVINDFNPLGIAFSLDDFGTGYSSVSYLKDLKVSEVKIDQTFVRDSIERTNDFIILKEIIQLCTQLGLEVVAEGVETNTHIKLLIALGCYRLQGYAIAKPMPEKATIEWIQNWSASPNCNQLRVSFEDLKTLIDYHIEHYRIFASALNNLCNATLDADAYQAKDCFFGNWLNENQYIFKNKSDYIKISHLHKIMHDQLITLIKDVKIKEYPWLTEQLLTLEKTQGLFASTLIKSTLE